MSSIKVVDINNEEVKQEEAIEQPIEEVKEEVNEVVEEPPQETKEVIEEEETKEQPKEETTKVKAHDRMVRCEKCNKEMKYKNFRYGHQQKCQGGIENKPVKPHTKARAKPIIKQVEVNEQTQEAPKQTIQQQIPQQQSQPSNPLTDITNHYQLLQNQYIQQKKEKYNNLCQNMFAPKSKKR